MALEIKFAPILHGEDAERFIKMANENLKKKHTIDFSKEFEIANKILKKAKL